MSRTGRPKGNKPTIDRLGPTGKELYKDILNCDFCDMSTDLDRLLKLVHAQGWLSHKRYLDKKSKEKGKEKIAPSNGDVR